MTSQITKLTEKIKESERGIPETFTFDEYLEKLYKNPNKHLRTASSYIKDVFDFYGRDKKGNFNLFKKKYHDANPVYGQLNIQKLIYKSLSSFEEEGVANKLILLVGPNGSSKTSIVKQIMKACEQYSKTDDGELYSFSWVFPLNFSPKNAIGFVKGNKRGENKSKEMSSVVYSELKDHPILLIPKGTRKKIIAEIYKNDQDKLNQIKKTYLYNGDLSKKNKDIFEALLKEYDQDYESVYKFIRVEKFHISRRYSKGAVTVEPQMHVDAYQQQITMDQSIKFLPPTLHHLNLFNMSGELVYANRGMLEFSDVLKRPMDTYKYLLMTLENKAINIKGILTELDIIFIATSNELHYSAFKQQADFKSYKERSKVIHVPYLLNYKEELKIYKDHLNHLDEDKRSKLEPNVLELFSLWTIMTRLHPVGLNKSYTKYEDDFKSYIKDIDVLTKALVYANSENLKLFINNENSKFYKCLQDNLKRMQKEYFGQSGTINNKGELGYEGSMGVSARETKEVLFDLLHSRKAVTPLSLFEALEKLSNSKILEAEKNISFQGNGGFFNNNDRIKLLKEYLKVIFEDEMRMALELTDSLAYEEHILKYIKNIKALLNNEKIYNDITKKYEDPNTKFVEEFENNVGTKGLSSYQFRSQVISTIATFSLDNKDKKIKYTVLFPEMYENLKKTFIQKQDDLITKISNNLDLYIEKKSIVNPEISDLIDRVLNNLTNKRGYSKECVLELISTFYRK